MADVVLAFAWKGAVVSLRWPPAHLPELRSPKPSREILEYAAPLRSVLPSTIPSDREYFSAFYDAMAFVLIKDGQRDLPIIGDTDQFHWFHAGSIRLFTESRGVGADFRLPDAASETFANACGVSTSPMTPGVRARLAAACGILSYAIEIHRDL